MSAKPVILVLNWLPSEWLNRLVVEFSDCTFLDGQAPPVLERELQRAVITYGLPPIARLPEVRALQWIQLASAGVPQDLCSPAARQGITVTNLAGLYGPSIAEHAFGLMLILARNLHLTLRNQAAQRWDRTVAHTMTDLHGRTLGIIGLGNIGRALARLGRAFGMRILGCRRTDQPAPFVDRTYPCSELHAMLAEADYVAVAAPLTARTEGLLGPAEFGAMKRGAIYINVSRGGVAQEQALLDALRSGQVAAAGLDVFAAEPLAADHPLWSLPQVIVSPHYSGETINQSSLPVERFARNLRAWRAGRLLEGIVDLECGY